MGEFIVAGLGNYSWVFVCLFLLGWALLRWAHYLLNRATLKPRFNPNKKRSISKKFDFYLRYFKRATTGRNYEKTSTKLDIYLFCVFIGSIVLVPIGLFLDGTRSWSISPDPMEWGVVGDFFGGMLNPILAFASFIALLYTIKLQTTEMESTRLEAQLSRKLQEQSTKLALENIEQQRSVELHSGLDRLFSGYLVDIQKYHSGNGDFSKSLARVFMNVYYDFDAKRVECEQNLNLTGLGIYTQYLSDAVSGEVSKNPELVITSADYWYVTNRALHVFKKLIDLSHKIDGFEAYVECYGAEMVRHCLLSNLCFSKGDPPKPDFFEGYPILVNRYQMLCKVLHLRHTKDGHFTSLQP
ncbi:hypothetical protein [Rheinheimera sp.]|uniref:hypothetical protein n=1 Tax=Rheinheimera sp. TaxID=1869214 RepID=UPI003D2E5AD4